MRFSQHDQVPSNAPCPHSIKFTIDLFDVKATGDEIVEVRSWVQVHRHISGCVNPEAIGPHDGTLEILLVVDHILVHADILPFGEQANRRRLRRLLGMSDTILAVAEDPTPSNA